MATGTQASESHGDEDVGTVAASLGDHASSHSRFVVGEKGRRGPGGSRSRAGHPLGRGSQRGVGTTRSVLLRESRTPGTRSGP